MRIRLDPKAESNVMNQQLQPSIVKVQQTQQKVQMWQICILSALQHPCTLSMKSIVHL